MKSDKRILIAPHPVLEQTSAPVAQGAMKPEGALLDLVRLMYAVCLKVKAAGLAAPQVGAAVRVVLIQTDHGPLIMVNPAWAPNSEAKAMGVERCFSTPGTRLPVERFERITVTFRNVEGTRRAIPLEGFVARVVQHECDHLDGVTLFTRMSESDQQSYLRRTKRQRMRRAS